MSYGWLLAYFDVAQGMHHFEVSSNITEYIDVFQLLTVVDCGTLTNPANSQVSYTGRTTFGQTATYSCDAGYSLVGNSTRTCQGVWSGTEPTCHSVLLSFNYYVYNVHTVCVHAQVKQYVMHREVPRYDLSHTRRVCTHVQWHRQTWDWLGTGSS